MDYSNIFKICYLGNIIIDEKKDVANENGIAISDIDSAEKMALKLKRICEKDMITEFVVISSDKDALYESACDKLKQALSAYNIEIVELDELFANKTSMERLFEIGRCVLVEAKTASRVSKIKKMVEFLDSNEIDIIGVIDYE